MSVGFHFASRCTNISPSLLVKHCWKFRSELVSWRKDVSTLFSRGVNRNKCTLGGRVLGLTLTIPSLAVLKLSIPKAKCESLKRSKASTTSLTQQEDIQFCWRSFWELLWPELWLILGAVISAFVVAFANIEIPLQLGVVVNKLTACATGERVVDFWGLMKEPAYRISVTYIMQGIFTFAYISLLSHSGERMAARMRQRLFENIIRQDMEFFDKHKTGAVIHRLTEDVQEFKSSFKMCISQGLRAVTQIGGSAIALIYVSPGLTGILLIAIPSLVGAGWILGAGLRALSRQGQEQLALATGIADEALGNVRTVRAFAMEDKEIELFNKEIDQSCQLNQRLGYAIGLFQGATNICLNGMVLGVLVAGGALMADNRLSAGDLMSFLVSTQTIQKSLGQLSLLYGLAIRGMSSGSRVFEYMKLKPSLSTADVGQTIPYHSLHGKVEFRNVQFSYPTRKDQVIMENLCLTIPGGEVTALVGLSGGGKSTIAQLLERFYDVDGGEITIDGVNIRDCSPKWLRGRCIGFISQEPVLFATSVLENIRYGKPGASDAEVKEAAILANAHDFITKFPSGYDTVLGERGVTVSGGQKQRIAIARALLKNPSIMILDEATSALDAESERVIQEALDRAVKGRTVLVIAHRLSTIKSADSIAVIDNGRVVEIGDHETLSKKKGAYWKLITNQQYS
ncbi:mitochondrial potassium channel ATP-binding subunit-like [Watersipora subatra]|uniref:mitochondrial potassium channel ATP-binding subunit-like n=1 Tax=Watersipora subatra TaxID=2589382 RepID=UPI00355B4D25